VNHLNQPWEAPAESRSVAAVEFYVVTELVDLDPEAVELDLMLPVVTRSARSWPGQGYKAGCTERTRPKLR